MPRFVRGSTYADAFGVQWLRYRRTQLDSHTGLRISAERLRRALGPELWEVLPQCAVLECGCGAGRFTEVLLERGAHVTSVDLSDAVDANALNFPIGDRHRVAQADVRELPFRQQQFSLVIALGVVQHTPRPEDTIAKLYEQVAPGGSLVLDHYTFSLARLTKLSGMVRFFTKRLPADRGMQVTSRLVELLLPIHERAGWLQPLLGRVSPIASYYRSYPQLNHELQREWSLLDTHDSLTDHYKRLRTPKQIERTLQRLGLQDIHCRRGGNGVEARGRRPG